MVRITNKSVPSKAKDTSSGLIFLKYISNAYEEKREQLLLSFGDPKGDWFIKDEAQRPEAADERDQYIGSNVFWLPPEARWHTINAKAMSPEIGKDIDDAMGAIERENPTLKGVLPRDYARPSLDTATRASANPDCDSHWRDFCAAKDHVRLGGLVDIISNIGFNQSAAKSKDVLGRVYEYFLGKFASAESDGKCECRSANFKFGTDAPFVTRNSSFDIRPATWKPARMNLAIRGIDANLQREFA